MTALCGGGSSAPKVGTDIAVAYSAGRLAQLLVAAGVGELSAWLPLAGVLPVILSGFCSTDPPAMTALTQAESDALANNTFGADFVNGLGKFKDVLLNLIWNDVCHCTSGTYTAPVPPAVDANTPVFQSPVPQPSQSCNHFGPFGPFPVNSGGGFNYINFHSRSALHETWIQINTVVAVNVAPGSTSNWSFVEWDSTGATLRSTAFNLAVSGTYVLDFPLLDRTASYFTTFNSGVGAGNSNHTFSWDMYCGTVPGTTPQPCCPPDQATQAYLDLIFKQVNLIQRQLAPFGYVPKGSTHTGLSGAGSFDISGLIGVSVDVTTLPGHYGVEGTSPPEYFDLGFLTFGTPDGYPSSFRLERQAQVLLPPRCSAFTTFAYELHPGVVVDVQELEREP